MPGDDAALIGFKRHLRANLVPGDGVYLTSGRGTVSLTGPQILRLAPLLDGSRSVAEVHELVADEIGPVALGQILGKLAQANLVGLRRPPAQGGPADPAAVLTAGLPGDLTADPAAEAYWDLADVGPDGAACAVRPAAPAVALQTLGTVEAVAAAGVLRAAGLTVHEPVQGPDRGPDQAAGTTSSLLVVLCDDYLDPRLAAINAAQLAAGRPWLPARITGADLWIGPFFRPSGSGDTDGGTEDAGACWSCLATRLSGHRRGEQQLRTAIGNPDAARPPEASLPSTRLAGLHLLALELTKWLAGARHPHQDAVWTMDTLSLQTGHHPVQRRPQCPACGDPGLVGRQVRRPVTPVSRPKVNVGGNGHRSLGAQQVWNRYGHLVDRVSGVVGAVQRDPRCPDFIHSYLSGPNLALSDTSLGALRAGLRQQAGGKGSTDLEARVSALCEAVERYSGSRFGDEPVVRGSLRELAGSADGDLEAIDPDTCQLFDPHQYLDRDRWNATGSTFQQVPEPFDADQVRDWTPVWSLTAGRHRLLPTDLLYFTRNGCPSLRANSNGNAAGSSLEDAIVQGFLELVERDAVALWWYNRTRAAVVDLSSFGDSWIDDLAVEYHRVDREFWVLDVSSDFGVPVMVAISRRTDKPAQDLMLGFGAHFDPRVALRRALTELGQLLPAVVDARPDGSGYGQVDAEIRHWWQHATIANQPYLCPDPEQKPLRCNDYAYEPRPDLKDDVAAVVELARRRGLEVLVLDQTRPDIGLPVVKVIVPGLRHFWARFAPGRLFDVPVRLGRLGRPTAYEDLNPIPLFM